eukprot:3447456-Amphidinium_carterae.1
MATLSQQATSSHFAVLFQPSGLRQHCVVNSIAPSLRRVWGVITQRSTIGNTIVARLFLDRSKSVTESVVRAWRNAGGKD